MRERVTFLQEPVEVAAGELPLEGSRDLLVVILESVDAISELLWGVEVVGSECLALEDGERGG